MTEPRSSLPPKDNPTVTMSSISSPFFCTFKIPPGHPVSWPHLPCNRTAVRFRPASAQRRADGSDSGCGFGVVDENMIVLRKRIHDMEAAERNYEPPAHWAEWEKQYYAAYGSDVCEFVGLVQTLLLRTRPGLAIGLAVLMAVSVPTSAVLIWVHVVGALKTGVFGG